MDLLLRDKTALVTGASMGIGRAIARLLAAEGVRVAAVARRRPLLESLAEEIGQAGGPPPALIAQDIMEEDAAARGVAAVFFAAVFVAAVLVAAVFVAVVFFAAPVVEAFFAGARRVVFFGAGPLARFSASSSAARSALRVATSSSRRSVALTSPSVTYAPNRPSLTTIGLPETGSGPSSASGGLAAARPRCLGWA